MIRILVITESTELRTTLQETLAKAYQLTVASTVPAALETLLRFDIDLMLIDLDQADGRGLDACRELTLSQPLQTPFLVFSQNDDIQNKLDAFASGAEDYLVKSMDQRELFARVAARLRFVRPLQAVLSEGAGIRIDMKGVKVLREEGGISHNLNLTPNEFRVLQILMGYAGKVVSRAELLSEGWGGNIHVLERTVDKHVSSLRKKLGDTAVCLEAIPGRGYRWVQERATERKVVD